MPNNKNTRRKNGDGNWGKRVINGVEYIYFRKNYEFLKSSKTYYGKTEKEIKEKVLAFESNLENKIDYNNIPKVSFENYIKYWLDNIKKKEIKRKTLDGYEDIITGYISPFYLAGVTISNLSRNVFENHVEELSQKYSKATIRKTYALIRQCMDYAVEEKHVLENYAKKVKLPSEDNVASKKKEARFLPEEDMEKLFHEAFRVCTKEEKVSGKREGELVYGVNAFVVVFIAYTGLRIGEALALKRTDIDMIEKTITVRSNLSEVKVRDDRDDAKSFETIITTPKTETSNRIVPLIDKAIDILNFVSKNYYRDDCEYVFTTNKNTPIGRRNVARTLNSMLKRANCSVKETNLHSLRHSLGSLLISHGQDVKVVSEILGHTDVAFTYNTYIHILKRQKVKSMNVIGSTKKTNNVEVNEDISILKLLQENRINVMEVQEGILGYILDMKIVTVPFTGKIELKDGQTILAKDIYNEYYK